jgi:phosphoglycerol transferase MdoB-like AlkP superfamily enzyme
VEPSSGPLLLPLVGFALVIVAKLWITRWIALGDANPLWALIVEGGLFVLLLTVPAILLPKWRVWAWLAVDVLASVVCVIVLVYMQQYEDVPTLAALALTRELGAVGDSVVGLLHAWYAWYFVDVVVLAAVFASPLRARLAIRKKPDARLLAVLGVSVVWSVVSVLAVATAAPIDDGSVGAQRFGLVAYGLFSRSPDEDSADQEVAAELESEPVAVETTGSAGSTATVLVRPAGKIDYHDPKSVQSWMDYLQDYASSGRVPGAPASGSSKGKNVIVIQVESLASWTVGAHVNGHPVTPNVDALIGTSWYAPRTVTQIGKGNTSDAEFTAMTSLLADRSSPASYAGGDKVIPSLPRLMRAQGYDALTFHPNVITFWKRNLLYPALGYSHWYTRPDFPQNDIVGIGASDNTLFTKVAQVLEAKDASRQKFLGDVVTLSSHAPYTAGSAVSDLQLPSDLQGTQTGRYLRALHYADGALGAFVARLKKDGLWDDSVIVVYGDHFGVRPWGETPYGVTSAEKREFPKIMGRQPQADDMYAIPFIVHVPRQTTGHRIDTVRAQVDIMPTIADLIGLDLSKTAHIGASMFDDRTRYEAVRYYASDGTFISNTVFFRPVDGYSGGNVIDLKTSKRLPLSTVPKTLYQQMHTLVGLDQAYLDALPARK